MVLTVTHSNNLKIYNLSSGKTIQEFLKKYKQNLKTLKKDVDWETRVDFIQNFEFSNASTKVEISRDGDYIVAAGVYGPQLRIFDTHQMTLKCMRGCDSEIVDFTLLEDDYKKIAMVCADRNVEIHTRSGKHFKVRIPRPPRCLLFEQHSSDLLVAGSSDEVYRLNLNEGRFASSFKLHSSGISSLIFNQYLELLLAGGDTGNVNLVDYRQAKTIGNVTLNEGEGVTTLQQSENQFEFWVGSDEGLVRLYDLRTSRYISEKRHPYMLPIKSIELIPQLNLVVSVDPKSIRITTKDNMNELIASYEQKSPINNLRVYKNSGLVVYSNDAPKIGSLFIPSIGSAPRFCQFLENITEEFEEKVNTNIFEDQKFLTYEELIALNGKSLLGTKKITAHLNGFLISEKLYETLRQVF